MLYLFLTGKNGAYLDDIFTTLHLPAGMLYSYKYNCRVGVSVVDPSITEVEMEKEDVLISYIDRDAAEERKFYVPLRKGLFVKYECTDGQCYVTVRLREYCYAKQQDQFSEKLLRDLGNELHRKTGNQEKTWQGLLAIRSQNSLAGELETTENSWYLTAERLSGRKLFKDSYSIFTRLEMQSADGKAMEPLEYGEESGYELCAGKKYKLMLSYYIPEFNSSVMTQKKHYMESRQNKIVTSLYPESREERRNTAVKPKPLMRVYSRNALSKPYTSRIDLSF